MKGSFFSKERIVLGGETVCSFLKNAPIRKAVWRIRNVLIQIRILLLMFSDPDPEPDPKLNL